MTRKEQVDNEIKNRKKRVRDLQREVMAETDMSVGLAKLNEMTEHAERIGELKFIQTLMRKDIVNQE